MQPHAVFVGILTPGTTSRMRAEALRELTPGWDWDWVDTDAPFRKAHRVWRSLAFRTKTGPAVAAINRTVLARLPAARASLVWVDKGVFLRDTTVGRLRVAAEKLVHFTPDTAFYANQSRFFERSLARYDLAVTTKSFEWETYRRFLPEERLHLCTQSYDRRIHFPRGPERDRRKEAIFVGLCEPDRERCVATLVRHGVPVRVAGPGWRPFVRRHGAAVAFEGDGVFGDAYAKLLSRSWVGLGLLSKQFPELHTTRTFEIPACGAVLATERTAETAGYFQDDEALFFQNHEELAAQVACLLQNDELLQDMAARGRNRVLADGRDYATVMSGILGRLRGNRSVLPKGRSGNQKPDADRRSSADPSRTAMESAAANGSALSTLCIGFLGADWWGSDARAMAAEFRRRGHLVLERHYEDHFPTRWRHLILKVMRRLLRPVMARDYNRAVQDLLAVTDLDFLLVFKGMLLERDTLAKFKRQGTPCYCYYPDVSVYDHGGNIPACLPLYDCVFTSKHFHVENEALRGLASHWVFAPHGFDPEVHRPVGCANKGLSAYACDVSFVGNRSAKKESTLAALRSALPEINLKIWGPDWGRARPSVRACWQGRGAYGDELAAIYSLSKINLGLLSEAGTGVASGDATTARTWQIPGVGGFLLHEDTPEVREAFLAGKEVALFNSAPALAGEVRRFLTDETTRKAIADAGHRRAMTAPYTYGRAVQLILDWHAGVTV